MSSKFTLLVSSMVLAASLSACTSAEKRNAEGQARKEEAARAQQQAEIRAQKDAETKLFTQLKPNELRTLVQDGVVCGYPLMAMDASKTIAENGNEFSHQRNFADPTNVSLVSTAWLDLSKEPLVFSVPAVGKKYYSVQIMDGWTNVVATAGSRSTGNSAGDFAIVGPQWEGQLPANVRRIQSPTNLARIVIHTFAHGAKDLALARTIQDRYRILPLSQFDRSVPAQITVGERDRTHVPSYAQRTNAHDMVTSFDAKDYFTRLSYLMAENPPGSQDKAALDKLARIGVAPGHVVNFNDLPTEVRRDLDEAVRSGYARVQELSKFRPGRFMNGWTYNSVASDYGTNYDARAGIAWAGFEDSTKEDVIFANAKVDSEGSVLNGSHKYVIRFAKGHMPPVNGIWSIAMHDSNQKVIANSLKRYSIGSNQKLKANKDGSVSLYIQNANPGKARVANWLPAPRGNFSLTAGFYWPKQALLNEEWQMPGVQRLRPTMRLTQKTAKRISQR